MIIAPNSQARSGIAYSGPSVARDGNREHTGMYSLRVRCRRYPNARAQEITLINASPPSLSVNTQAAPANPSHNCVIPAQSPAFTISAGAIQVPPVAMTLSSAR